MSELPKARGKRPAFADDPTVDSLTAMVLGATVANRWFTARRGLVIGIFTAAGGYLTDGPAYAAAAAAGMADDLEWGGDWTTFVDRPHYQLATGMPLAELRARFESGAGFD